ncbi:MAG: DUF2220 family protein, partial [Campylobacterota bacterium]|nr:DUF2220 family protein [Campylobacterota bacterium]
MAHFYDSDVIIKKALRLYERGHLQKAYIDDNEQLFPYRIGLKKVSERGIKTDFNTIRKEAEALLHSRLPCETKCFRFASIGEQTLPVVVVFETRKQLLAVIEKEKAFSCFVERYEMIMRCFPALKTVLSQKSLLVERYEDEWERLLAVCRFFVSHPAPALYIRELSIEGVDTKFIETHKKVIDLLLMQLLDPEEYHAEITTFSGYGFERKYNLNYPKPLIRFRILDPRLKIAGVDDMSLPLNQFSRLELSVERIFVIENKVTFLSFPPLPQSIVIFGSGYSVGYLKEAKWLNSKKLIYWGDIDSHGFSILSQFRAAFSNVVSFLMDHKTAVRFERFAIEEPSEKTFEGEAGFLTVEERILLEDIRNKGYRLEQER